MIISKDLFLLGEQDYLRLPKDEKRRIKSSSNTTNASVTGNGGAVAGVGGVIGAGGGASAVVSSAAVIASTGMGKDPNDDLR